MFVYVCDSVRPFRADFPFINQTCHLFVFPSSAGKHVLCEKPLTLHLPQTKELYQLAKSKNVFFMEAIWSRCSPVYRHIQEEIEKGVIGEVSYVHLVAVAVVIVEGVERFMYIIFIACYSKLQQLSLFSGESFKTKKKQKKTSSYSKL